MPGPKTIVYVLELELGFGAARCIYVRMKNNAEKDDQCFEHLRLG